MPSLQEYIALGEYETGLAGCEHDDQEEIIRLPLLLRLLSQCQADDMECLEDRAAKYSQAEHIHVLACHLAPAVCRAWQRSRSSNAKKNKKQQRGGKVNAPAVDEEEDNEDEDDDGDVLMTISNVMDEDDDGAPDKDGGDDAMDMDDTAATGGGAEKEDSQEVVLHNTLQELYTKSRSSTAVLSEDSILFQPTGGAILASLMHYAPQLRHKQVAQLIVRSGHCELQLLKYLAANCPAAEYTIETVLPGFMGDEEDDLDALACRWIARPDVISNVAIDRAIQLMNELAKFPGNLLYCKALVWTMIQLQRPVTEAPQLRGVPLLVATVLAVQKCDACVTLLRRIAETETDEHILFALLHREKVLDVVAGFLQVTEIENEYFLDCIRLFAAAAATTTTTTTTQQADLAVKKEWKDPAVILEDWKSGGAATAEEKKSVETTLQQYLESQADAEELAKSPIAADFISTAVHIIENPAPLIHAIALERMCLTSRVDAPLFMIRLLYCFAFHEAHPESPFCFNPRNLPLRQILLGADSWSWGPAIIKYIDDNCSETTHIARYFGPCPVVDWKEQIQTRKGLREVVKCAVLDSDDNGEAAESAFLEAAKVLSDADLTTTTVASLLARKGTPLPFLTYAMLYNDPISILKCPLSLWNRPSLLRLILFILQLLLEVNGAIVWKKARSPELATEFIVSRDLVVLHCIMGVATNVKTKTACLTCELLRSFVRKMVAQHRGLVASLVRQDVSEEILDWLIQWVPETVCDCQQIQQFLCDKSQWTSPTTRLRAADFSVRIAIAHGHRLVKESSSMVGTALSVLLSSFFLVLGPVGVSVDASRGGEGNAEVTPTSRRAAFRLLRATHKIRLYRKTLRAEILPALQKMIGMCKGELIVGTLPSSVTGKQKAFLKDFGDAIAKSIDMLGTGV